MHICIYIYIYIYIPVQFLFSVNRRFDCADHSTEPRKINMSKNLFVTNYSSNNGQKLTPLGAFLGNITKIKSGYIYCKCLNPVKII